MCLSLDYLCLCVDVIGKSCFYSQFLMGKGHYRHVLFEFREKKVLSTNVASWFMVCKRIEGRGGKLNAIKYVSRLKFALSLLMS